MTPLLDTSVFIGHWPFQPLKMHTCASLKTHLVQRGITQAWVANADAILFADPMQGNAPLFAALQKDAFFVPVVIINPTLGTWRNDLKRCIAQGAGAVKLLPNYHQYPLDQPAVAELVELVQDANLPICVQIRITDERAHHPLMKVPSVPVGALATLAQQHPQVRFLACALFHAELAKLAGVANVWAELSHIESQETLATALQVISDDHLVFGSHSPFLYLEAVLAKLHGARGVVQDSSLNKVRHTNAQLLLGQAVE